MNTITRSIGTPHLRFYSIPDESDEIQSKSQILPDEVRTKKPSLRLNFGANGLKAISEPPPMAGQAGCLQGEDRSAVTIQAAATLDIA
ncbi:hypothetical protein J6590_067284 [Homalodisca vitripennis]|nr:hypothetical protein J6590_067284 [Homalodisca vitripennis]